MTKVACLLTSDWHMSDQPPACRAETKKEWYEVQGDYLDQLSALQKKHGHVPILHAGDVSDRWDSPAELVNFLIDRMPHVFAVAGNHDLPNHSLADIKRSSYWTLVQAGRISNLNAGWHGPVVTGGLALFGYPHGMPPGPRPTMTTKLNIAVVHRYVWAAGMGHPNARSEDHVREAVKDYPFADVIHTGDNHAGITLRTPGKPTLMNCGTFIRRKSDEVGHAPFVGLVREDGTTSYEYLDTFKDRFREADEKAEEVGLDATEVIKELNGLGDAGVNFEDSLRHYLKAHKVVGAVAEAVYRAIEEAKR